MTHPEQHHSPGAFVLPTDDDDLAELASVGIHLTTKIGMLPSQDEQHFTIADRNEGNGSLDNALASLIRQLGRAQISLNRYDLACQAEIAAVEARYKRITAPLIERCNKLEGVGKYLASQVQYPGKTRSRETAWGAFGLRKKPEHVGIIDAKALLEWARAQAPTLIEVVVPPVVEKIPQKAVAAYVKATGDIPPGVKRDPASDEPFVKPDLIALESV